MPRHTLIRDGRAQDAAQFNDPSDLSALEGNETIEVLYIANDAELDLIAPALGRIETCLLYTSPSPRD